MAVDPFKALGKPHRLLFAGAAGISVEPCGGDDCQVDIGGVTSCGSIACPACGRGGANLSITQLLPSPTDVIACGCGNTWKMTPPDNAFFPENAIMSTAELAECTCPEFCERDHDLD